MEIVKPYFLTEYRLGFLPLINQNKYFFSVYSKQTL